MTDNAPLRIAFTTLGCKVNQSETDLLARQFTAAGYSCVPFDAPADVYVVNTCTVTHVADKKSRQILGQARRANPDALLVATGCYASIAGEALADDRTLVVRNRDKDRLAAIVQGRVQRTPAELPYFAEPEKYLDLSTGETTPAWRSRAQVKAQDGCDSHCTYCIIPRARGRSRSVPPDQVIGRVQALVREGHAEVVITGVDLGSYGEEASLPDLGGLLERILEETEVERIRVSSLEPGDFDLAWLPLWESPRLCRHLHVPLQSGSAAVLQRMERKYSPGQFADMVAALRRAIHDVTITTDVMVGFPGETDEEFDAGYHFIREMRFDGMHVFKYSKRSGTRAARFPDQVPEPVKHERSRLLREEAQMGVDRLIGRHANRVLAVVWESQSDGIWRGLTDTSVRVYGSSHDCRVGSLARARLTFLFRDGLWSESVHPEIPLAAAPS
jgi:threonylcarbamoyladenosine tRNA methylthiotransferase MtaB